MIAIEFLEALKKKQFFRFTGPPEHWLTAIKYRTWGLREDQLNRWLKIKVGDVFLMHSTAKSLYGEGKSSIIGIGVVGLGMSRKEHFLWEEEVAKRENIYPLLVPFSEMYLFSPEIGLDDWEVAKHDDTKRFIRELLKAAIPLPKGFPVMGSWSEVNAEMAIGIIQGGMPENLIEGEVNMDDIRTAHTPLEKMDSSKDGLRYTPTLKYLQPRKAIKYTKKTSTFERDNELLERAGSEHQRIIDESIQILKNQGYNILGNLHVDLAAENEKEILLFEAKSIPENKFRIQARHAVGQLYQYEYFDVAEHLRKSGESEKPIYKKLLIPHDPNDKEYIEFVEWMDIDSVIPSSGLLKKI